MWTTALADCRSFLGDDPTDKNVWQQRLLGRVDGTNKIFKAFNIRLVTSPAPSVFVDGASVPFTVTDALTGTVTITTAPLKNTDPTITSYYQFWTDAELLTYIRHASQMIIEGDDETLVPIGLQIALKHFVAEQAYNNLSVRFTESRSAQFHMDERKQEDDKPKHFLDLAKYHGKMGAERRAEYYKRLGKRDKPTLSKGGLTAFSYMPRR